MSDWEAEVRKVCNQYGFGAAETDYALKFAERGLPVLDAVIACMQDAGLSSKHGKFGCWPGEDFVGL